jgi:poly(A) polymerase
MQWLSLHGEGMVSNNMETVCAKLLKNEFLILVSQLAMRMGVAAYFVGGGLRDVLMNREMKDLDFVLSDALEELPLCFAEQIQGTFLWLDRLRFQSRVVKKYNRNCWNFDFAPLRGQDIAHDLRLRDFTINALALNLTVEQQRLIDPCNGLSDLKDGVIRACHKATFDSDPLRLLRALRFSSVLEFSIESETWRKIGEKASLLRFVAPERIREEFFQILETQDAGTALERVYECGLLAEIIPVNSIPHVKNQARWLQRINGVREVEAVMHDPGLFSLCEVKQIRNYLSCEVESGVTVGSLVKLAVLLRENECDQTMVTMTSQNLMLGRKARRFLENLGSEAVSALTEPEWKPSERAMYRFFKDNDPAGLAIIIAALGRKLLTCDFCSRMSRYYFDEFQYVLEETLLSGKEIMNLLGIGPGKKVGEAMEFLRKAERTGLVNNKQEAEELLSKNILTKDEAVI